MFFVFAFLFYQQWKISVKSGGGRCGRDREREAKGAGEGRGGEGRRLAASSPAGLGFSSHKPGEIHTSQGVKRL